MSLLEYTYQEVNHSPLEKGKKALGCGLAHLPASSLFAVSFAVNFPIVLGAHTLSRYLGRSSEEVISPLLPIIARHISDWLALKDVFN